MEQTLLTDTGNNLDSEKVQALHILSTNGWNFGFS